MQLALWRIRLPKRQTRAIIVLFVGTFCCGHFTLWKYGSNLCILGIYPPNSLAEHFQLSIYFLSLTLAYLITYSAIEVDSPSLLIVIKIFEAGSFGLSKESLEHEFDNAVLIEPRINDLIRDKMAEFHEGKYRLRMKGILLAQLFTFYRNMLKAGKGG
jgi:hypothetical protein